THAILDGLHRRYIDATHPDTRAFHEAFADLVALLQHFSFPEVLRHQIAQTRGDLKRQNLLGQLAQQFGLAIGGYGSLRDAIGDTNQDGTWTPREPDPRDYENLMECHQRGAILVTAIFDAFLKIYQTRIRKLLRIATGGTGVLPDGELHPDLVDEMSKSAAATAKDVLRICIRALDYCPPFDLTFGDYLRAILTADFDMVPDDAHGFRVAFVEAFQKRGISAAGIRSMAVEDLLYPLHPVQHGENRAVDKVERALAEFLRRLKNRVGYARDRRELYERIKELSDARAGLQYQLKESLVSESSEATFTDLTGLMFPGKGPATEKLGLEFGYKTKSTASFVVGNVWLANRVTPNGEILNHVVITLVQKRGVRFIVHQKTGNIAVDEKNFFVPDKTNPGDWGENAIIFRGGCTLIFDLDSLRLRYAIKKDIDDHDRMIRQFRFEKGLMGGESGTYFNSQELSALAGPFALTHSHSAVNGGGHDH
ncbi:MAG: hypothetical protein KDA85_14155, partial [Planctomycetaceae bacterium]|nr:hypothetical protein [Planctomycetaceae bacterium]